MSFRVVWNVPMYVIEHGFAKGRESFMSNFEFNMSEAARNIGSFVRTNHPWQNRTGDAEREFNVEYGDKRMVMEHGVPYGKYLESMQGGKFGIIPAAFTYGKPIIQEAMQRSLDQAYRS